MTDARPRRQTKPRSEWKTRATLFVHGRRGAPDRVRVLVDATQQRVEVHYKDGTGVRRREHFDNDRKGRAAAVAWAEAFVEEMKTLGGAKAETTHAELWAAYKASPAWADLRATSHPSYEHRWKRWVKVRGATTKPDDTTLRHIDRFIMTLRTPPEGVKPVALNQIREALNVVRTVYRWGHARELLTKNVFEGYRWKTPKDAIAESPPEYTGAEFDKLLAELPPQDGRRWRAHVALMIAGHHGMRANAVLNLRWEDIDDSRAQIVWPARFQKNGRALPQPMTWDMVAALETARHWRRLSAYEGPWVFFAGGGNRRLGTVRASDVSRGRAFTRGTTRAYRRERTPEQDTAYSYQALWLALTKAEQRAGVTHRPYRAMHGLRKMVAGNIADRTGDARLALEFIGDDIRQAPRYLQRRDERLDRAADAAQTKTPAPKEER